MRITHHYIKRIRSGISSLFGKMSETNRLDTWNERWKEGRSGWHKTEVNFALLNHGKALLPSSKHRVLVPLCGKSVDLKWCYDEGHHVVGIEGIEQPVKEFFTEHNIPFSVVQMSWAKLYKSTDERLQLYCCDLFKIDIDALGKFDAVYDRGSLVAIYEEDRKKYVEIMKSLFSEDFRYLINLIQYKPTETFNGPPRNIPTPLIEDLFGDEFKVEELESYDRTEEDPKVKGSWGLDALHEVVVLLTHKK